MARPSRIACVLVLMLATGALWPARAVAQVRRCTGSDGSVVFTDRRCADLGATEQPAPPPPPGNAPGMAATQPLGGGCARNLQDLEFALRAALDTHDVNRLAGLYHWTGASSASAEHLMTRLDVIAQRPLVDIVPVQARIDTPPDADGNVEVASRPTPIVALQVEQTLANGTTPARTVFGLRRHLDCWWIHL